MPKYHCAAVGCTNADHKWAKLHKYPDMLLDNGEVVKFYLFPSAVTHQKLRGLWVKALRRVSFEPTRWDCVCSRHFVDGKVTAENSVPTLFVYNNYGKKAPRRQTTRSALAQLQSKPERGKQPSEEGPRQPSEPAMHMDHHLYVFEEPFVQQQTVRTTQQTMPNSGRGKTSYIYHHPPPHDHDYVATSHQREVHTAEEIHLMAKELDHLRTQLAAEREKLKKLSTKLDELQEKLRVTEGERSALKDRLDDKDTLLRDLFMERVTSSDEAVRDFLGLPSKEFLMSLFSTVQELTSRGLTYWHGDTSLGSKKWHHGRAQKPGPQRKLTPFQEFVMVLLRLKGGFLPSFLAAMFHVSAPQVSRTYASWITMLDAVLKPLMKWPTKKKVKKHMPLAFKLKYPATRAIIDCTEFFVTKPRNPTAQSCTWSNYKTHNTLKCLMAITPNGAFSFVSDLWSGNISDRAITEKSGFLDLVEKDDSIMADRGFVISDLLMKKGAHLNMPPFTRACTYGKGRHLTAREIRQTRTIASLRVHVERAIGRLKKYRLFDGIIPLTLRSVLNQSIRVAAALCNLQKPLISKL